MILLQNLSFAARNREPLFDRVDLVIPSDRRVALLGGFSSGKTSLIQLLAGLAVPNSGRIVRHARLSFPAGYQRGFRVANTARQNLMFAAQIYGADARQVVDFVADVTGLGAAVDRPMRDLSVQSRQNLSYALTYALPFDTYLFDNSIGPGDPDFRQRCADMYHARTRQAGAIFATRHPRLAREFCDSALLIEGRSIRFYDDVEEALALFTPVAAEPVPEGSIDA